MEKTIEHSFLMIKPDGVKKDILEHLLDRIVGLGFNVENYYVARLTEVMHDEHYSHVTHIPQYPQMKAFMLSDYVVFMMVSGFNVVASMKAIIGPTDSRNALPGTIRGDYGNKEGIIYRNIVHCSDTVEGAQVEIERFFGTEAFNKLVFSPRNTKSMALKRIMKNYGA